MNKGWVPGKSAWETANAWTGSGYPAIPANFRQLFESHELGTETIIEHGVVERQTPLRYPSGPRNHDLALWGRNHSDKVFVGIESKANDGFSGTMQQQLEAAKAIRLRGKNTNLDLRTEWLSRCLVGVPLLLSDEYGSGTDRDREARHEVLKLPYQLFAAVAGTLLEASHSESGLAVFVVHQFRTCFTDDSEIEIDGRLLDKFVSLLLKKNPACTKIKVESAVPLQYGKLIGPIYLDNRDYGKSWTLPSGIPLLIGKLLTDRTEIQEQAGET